MGKGHAVRLVLGLAVCVATVGAVPAVAMAGSISGTVTDDAVTPAPIAGIQVCSHVSPYTFEDTCVETNAGGAYMLDGLPAGSYSVRFSADLHNLDYVNEYYDDESHPGDPVTIGANEARTGVDAELRAGGTIAGSVTDSVSHGPVAAFLVCAFAQTATAEVGRCARTDSSGAYAIRGLPTEEYMVEFLSEDEFNYLTQYWEGSEAYNDFEPVSVTEGATTSGIDAALNPGAVIAGTLTEVGTHHPLAKIAVNLLDPVSEEVLRTVHTDSSGHYAFRGRPAGTYVVAFSGPENSFDGDGFSTQYYKGAASFAAATPLTVAPPEALTGIDGEVVNEFPPVARPRPIQVTLVPVARPPVKDPCRKGFHKKKVNGKVRCVKKHKKRHRKGGPRAGTTKR